MKTKVMAAFAAVMMALSMNAKSGNETVANPESVSDAKVTVETIQNNPQQKVVRVTNSKNMDHKYEYNLDDQNRVVNRICYSKDDAGNWTPYAAYTATYTNDESVLSYAEYDSVSKTFTKNAEQARYNKADFPVVLVLPSVLR